MRALTVPDADPGGSVAATDTVPGILCRAGHFNHPRWRYCHTCGSALSARSSAHVRGPRPVVGMLLRDDGFKVAVSAPLVIVLRDNAQAPTCVPWHDRGRSLVRVGIRFTDWQPILHTETPGAWLRRPAYAAAPLVPGTPTPLHGAWTVHLGRGSFLYESLAPGEPEPFTDDQAAPTKGRHRARRTRLPDPAIFPRRSTP